MYRLWLLLTLWLTVTVGQAKSPQLTPVVTAKSALLADVETGKILWKRNPDLTCYPASLTKIMTAVIILEHANLDDWVIVTKESAFTGESSIGLKEGEEIRLRDLLNSILVRSANDACVASSVYLIGSVDRFVMWMNSTAKKLGMNNTNFENPHGLHSAHHFTTARDLLTLTRYALQKPEFRKIVATKEIIIPPTNKSALRHYVNRNKILWLYPGCDGVKTGYTALAGKCLIATATRNEWQLITIVLDSQDQFADGITLLDYGFNNFVRLTLTEKDEPLALLRVPGGNPDWMRAGAVKKLQVIMPKAKLNRIRCYVRQSAVTPPIKRGQTIGEAIWELPTESEHRIDLVALQSVDWSLEAKVHRFGERFLLAFFISIILYVIGRLISGK